MLYRNSALRKSTHHVCLTCTVDVYEFDTGTGFRKIVNSYTLPMDTCVLGVVTDSNNLGGFVLGYIKKSMNVSLDSTQLKNTIFSGDANYDFVLSCVLNNKHRDFYQSFEQASVYYVHEFLFTVTIDGEKIPNTMLCDMIG